jgi:hypothetical protein
MEKSAQTELARIWGKIEAIRAKQAAKPTGSALPQKWNAAAPVLTAEEREAVRQAINSSGLITETVRRAMRQDGRHAEGLTDAELIILRSLLARSGPCPACAEKDAEIARMREAHNTLMAMMDRRRNHGHGASVRRTNEEGSMSMSGHDLPMREESWAEMSPDMYGGPSCDGIRPRWLVHSEGDKGDSAEFDICKLDARAFPPGTTIVISEPVCPDCDESRDYSNGDDGMPKYAPQCSCGFDWATWTESLYS